MVMRQEKKPKDKIPPSYKEIPDAAKYDESLHWVKFNYIEQPGQMLEFTYGKIIWNEKTGRLGTRHEKWIMHDGKVYELPKYIIDHLSSLEVPDPKMIKMSNGELRLEKNRTRNRFSFGMATEPTNKNEIMDARVIKGRKT